MEAVKKWIYGGQDRAFFRDYYDHIHYFNIRTVGLLQMIMAAVTAVYFIFDLNSVEWAMRLSYLWYFLFFEGWNKCN